jgi:hypothetical protein
MEKSKNLLRGPTLVLASLLLASCVTAPTTPKSETSQVTNKNSSIALKNAYSLLAQEGGKVFALAPNTSRVRIYAFRSGSAARLGHNHVLAAPEFTGFFYLPSSGIAHARFDLEFRLDQLEIDNPSYRASLGQAFASVLSPEAIEATRQHMLGADGLQAEQFPFVRIHSLSITGESPRFAAKVQIEIHGQSHEIWVPLVVDGLPDSLTVSGSFVLRQTDFGIKPYSALGGILAVGDEVVVEFHLVSG